VQNNIVVNGGGTLTIDPGVTIRFNTGLLSVGGGTLVADGGSANGAILLTSPAASGAGQWQGVYLGSGSATLHYAIIEDAGSSNVVSGCCRSFGIGVDGGSVTLDHLVVRNNLQYGIEDRGSDTLTVSNSDITGNGVYGIFDSGGSGPVIATGNWWGSSTGPTNALLNPGGLGDAVSSGVSFVGWVLSAITNN